MQDLVVEIKNNKGNTRIWLKNFLIIKDSSTPVLVNADIEVEVDNFKAKVSTTIFQDEIQGMLTNLEVLYKTLTKTFCFFDLDKRVSIKFVPAQTGHVHISGNIKSVDYKDSLEFAFTTDQTFMLELINQIKKVLTTLGK